MTEARNRKSQSINLKPASLEQLWSCLQRCLLFEEPSSRWERLMTLVSRHVNARAKELIALPMPEQQIYFKTVFGTPENLLDLPARFFNLVLAMQDLRRFEAAEYDVWYLSQSNDNSTQASDPLFFDIAQRVLGAEPVASQVASLSDAWDVVPYWRVLEASGPWSDDPLADFASLFLEKLDIVNPVFNTDYALRCESVFLDLVKSRRSELPTNFQPSLLVLVEGITETILLPRFLSLSTATRGKEKNSAAAFFVACGGANQLMRKYLHLQDIAKLPILCVMDHDAESQIETISGMLRRNDHLHVWSVGEIEDTFAVDFLLDNLNAYLSSLGVSDLLLLEDLAPGVRRTEMLDRLWRSRGLGDFNKVDFAEFQLRRFRQLQDVPVEARQLIDILKQMTTGNYGK